VRELRQRSEDIHPVEKRAREIVPKAPKAPRAQERREREEKARARARAREVLGSNALAQWLVPLPLKSQKPLHKILKGVATLKDPLRSMLLTPS
jgi:hypothetical protein